MTANINVAADSIAALARDNYRDIALYNAPRDYVALDLSDNTNLWGAPPSALRVIAAASEKAVSRYPTAYEPSLTATLADYVGVSPDMIACGCGSDDVLDSAIRAFAQPGEVLALPDPSFTMIPVFARTNGMVPVAIPLTNAQNVDVDAMIETGARIIYLCTPNNPTGGALPRETVEQIVDRAPGLVIVDQAYVEFGGVSFVDLVSSGRPVLVTRTMSKAFGLAGLRIGYGVGAPELITEVLKARGPYKVSSLAERAATAALKSDMAWVTERIKEVVVNRSRLRAELKMRGISSLESAANFILVPITDCVSIAAQLESIGVRVRALPQLSGIGDAIRVAVGPLEMMQRFLDALEEVA
jgi:histidinol-phosphate aminotransferase